MNPLLWSLFGCATVLALLTIYALCSISGRDSELERQAKDAGQYDHARLRVASQAIVAAMSTGRPGMSTYVPCDLLWALEDALGDDRAAYPESKFDCTGEP